MTEMKLTTGQAYGIYKDRLTRAKKDPVSRKSFERYLRDGSLPSKKVKGKRVITVDDLESFCVIRGTSEKLIANPSKATPARTTGKVRSVVPPKKKKLGFSPDMTKKQVDALVWGEIQKQLVRELFIEAQTPRLVKQALKCVSNKKAKKLLESYIDALEGEVLAHGQIKSWDDWWQKPPGKKN